MDATVIVNQTWQNQSVKNVLVFNNILNDPVDLQSFADEFRDIWATTFIDRQAVTYSLNSLTFQFNEVAPIFSVEVGFTLGQLSGTSNQDELPATDCLLVSTKYVGPAPNKGRIYLAGLTELATGGGLFLPTTLNDAQALVEKLRDGVSHNSGDSFLRIARRTPDGLIDSTSPVQIVIAQPVPATMRSRRLGVGS